MSVFGLSKRFGEIRKFASRKRRKREREKIINISGEDAQLSLLHRMAGNESLTTPPGPTPSPDTGG